MAALLIGRSHSRNNRNSFGQWFRMWAFMTCSAWNWIKRGFQHDRVWKCERSRPIRALFAYSPIITSPITRPYPSVLC